MIEIITIVDATLDTMIDLIALDYGHDKASWIEQVKKELPNMKAAKEVMIRKRAESKQWAPNTVAACLRALQLMENKYQKLTAIQALLELWVSNDTEAMLPWLDKVKV